MLLTAIFVWIRCGIHCGATRALKRSLFPWRRDNIRALLNTPSQKDRETAGTDLHIFPGTPICMPDGVCTACVPDVMIDDGVSHSYRPERRSDKPHPQRFLVFV